jgi:hypothetical protein
MLTFFPGLVLQPMKCDGCRLEYFQVSSFKPKKQDGKKGQAEFGSGKARPWPADETLWHGCHYYHLFTFCD